MKITIFREKSPWIPIVLRFWGGRQPASASWLAKKLSSSAWATAECPPAVPASPAQLPEFREFRESHGNIYRNLGLYDVFMEIIW